jgi:hypothetical protein
VSDKEVEEVVAVRNQQYGEEFRAVAAMPTGRRRELAEGAVAAAVAAGGMVSP